MRAEAGDNARSAAEQAYHEISPRARGRLYSIADVCAVVAAWGGAVPMSYLSRHPNFQPRNNALILLIIKQRICELPSCLIS